MAKIPSPQLIFDRTENWKEKKYFPSNFPKQIPRRWGNLAKKNAQITTQRISADFPAARFSTRFILELTFFLLYFDFLFGEKRKKKQKDIDNKKILRKYPRRWEEVRT